MIVLKRPNMPNQQENSILIAMTTCVISPLYLPLNAILIYLETESMRGLCFNDVEVANGVFCFTLEEDGCLV